MHIISNRSLTRNEAAFVVAELRRTPNIIGYTVEEWIAFRDVWVVTYHDELAGYDELAGVAVNIDLLCGWSEMAVLYVPERYRNQGIGKDLFRLQCQALRGHSRHIYTASRNPVVISWMWECGFAERQYYWQLPFPVHLHNVYFMLNRYRIREALRKLSMQGGMKGFRHGILLVHK